MNDRFAGLTPIVLARISPAYAKPPDASQNITFASTLVAARYRLSVENAREAIGASRNKQATIRQKGETLGHVTRTLEHGGYFTLRKCMEANRAGVPGAFSR